jgi:tetrathionate reductase subunit B
MMNNPSDEIDPGRRGFLGAAAGVATLTLAPGILLHTMAGATPRTDRVTDAARYGMLIDTARCAEGCTACITACNHENGLDLQRMPEGMDSAKWDRQEARWIRKVKLQDNLTGRVTNLPMLCQHCEHPPCVDVCPTGASFKRADGIVLVDRHLCIGCRYCMMACPYKARSFIHTEVEEKLTLAPRGKGCVESCNLCVHRRDNGQPSTACADACAAQGQHAILFGDLKNPESALSKALAAMPNRQIRENLALNTGVRYSGL